jgi:hypothetical protein
MNTARSLSAGAGIQTAGLAFGEKPPTTGDTEEYDGSYLDIKSYWSKHSKI